MAKRIRPSDWLAKQVKSWIETWKKQYKEGQLSTETRRALANLASDRHERPRFRAEANDFHARLLQGMEELPDHPTYRKDVPATKIAFLMACHVQVRKSYDDAKLVMELASALAEFRSQDEDDTYRSVYKDLYANSFPGQYGFQRFKALGQWLWNKTEKGIAYEKKRAASPSRKKQIAKNRSSKEAKASDAERKRAKYWRDRGLEPPERAKWVEPAPVELLTDEEVEQALTMH